MSWFPETIPGTLEKHDFPSGRAFSINDNLARAFSIPGTWPRVRKIDLSMSTEHFLVFTGIAPHPPIMVPEIGGDAIVDVQDSIDAMAEFTRRLKTTGAETVVLISPHAPLEANSFVAYHGPTVHGDFSRFQAPDTQFSIQVDDELLTAITETAAKENFSIIRIAERVLDHGIAVPLYFLIANGWHGKVVALGYSFLSNDEHLRFGSCIRRAVEATSSAAPPSSQVGT